MIFIEIPDLKVYWEVPLGDEVLVGSMLSEVYYTFFVLTQLFYSRNKAHSFFVILGVGAIVLKCIKVY